MDSNNFISIQDILSLKSNIFESNRVKLIRHKDNRKEYRDIIKNRDELKNYQTKQKTNVFNNTDYIISFIGQPNNNALLFGIFKINGFKINESSIEERYIYDIEEIEGFEDFNDRIIIKWGVPQSARKWDQWYSNKKEIVEILPKGYVGSFPGLTNFVLDFEELERLINNPDSNRDWKTHLSSVNGIYMILDKKMGNQYIGSACGKEGIWQRWVEYVKTKTGGNVCLKELCEKNENYHKNFQFTVLQTLPSNLNKIEVDEVEKLYKLKFGTKSNGGLNRN